MLQNTRGILLHLVLVPMWWKPRQLTDVWFIQEEPGGQRALIFDQGNRISQVKTELPVQRNFFIFWLIYNINELLISNYRLWIQGISCADVADICVKALHDSTARNKSFDVGNPSFCLDITFKWQNAKVMLNLCRFVTNMLLIKGRNSMSW